MSANSSSAWTVGQKVVCINDSFPVAVLDWCVSLPVAGHIYTIRGMQIGYDEATKTSNLGFLLVEIVNPLSSLGCEAGFVSSRFVPWLEVGEETKRNDALQPVQLA